MRIAIFSMLALAGLAGTALGQGLAPHTIVVTGRAEVMLPPDYATIDLGVVSTAKSVAGAAQQNSVLMASVISALARNGIPAKDIQTTKYNVEAVHPRRSNNGDDDETKTIGYQVANKVTVTVTDVTNLAKVIDAATGAGANSVDSINFDVKDRAAAEDAAKTAAVKDARHQATILAGAEGAKVTKMIAMTTGALSFDSAPAPAPPPAMMIQTTQILPGQVSVSASITVQYGLE